MKTKKKLLSHLPINPFTHIPFLILFTLTFMLAESCNTTEPNANSQISLSVEDVSCTEAWLKLETQNLNLPASVSLLQNNSVGQTFSLSKPDTTIYIDSLMPNKTYTFQVLSTRLPRGMVENPASSNEIQVQTLDTTSHNFTWQQYTFGGEQGAHGPSNIWDIAIIDRDNIWAVGAIYLNDSTGNPDPNAYNAIHWNGTAWKLFKLQFFTFCGQTHTGSYPTRAVFSLNDGTVLISSGSQLTYIKDKEQFKTECVPVSINSIWGKSSEDFYIVGNGGSIAHYQNGQWSKIESGTNIRLTDIYGTPDGKNIWACGWDNRGTTTVLEIGKNEVKTLYNSQTLFYPYIGNLNGLWSNGSEYIIAGSLVFRHSIYYKKQVKSETVATGNGYKLFEPGNFVFSVRGSSKNNIFIGGDNIMLWHFNGISWHKFEELYSSTGRIYSIDVSDIVAAGGNVGAKGWIAVGKR